MSFSDTEKQEIKDAAELEVRRYFDHYLENVFPEQVTQMVQAHNLSPDAHGGVERRFNKMAWMVAGLGLAGGGTVAGIMKLFQ
jgi:hypothetical protein